MTENIKVEKKHRPSLKDRLKNIIGMQSREGLQKSWRLEMMNTDEEDIEIADENGNIKHRTLNVGLLKKYQNPYKILYLWSVQETLEVLALTESI